MIKKVKNIDSESHTWVGQIIEPNEYYTINPLDYVKWANNDVFLTAIADSLAMMNDGDVDITGINDQIDFLKGNENIPKDSDGTPLSRLKVTSAGWNYQLHGIEFKTSQLDSVVSKKEDGTDFGFTTLKCYDSNGNELTTQLGCNLSAVKTVVDWEPNHDYEIVGGLFKQASIPGTDIRVWVVGVPDIPAQYGGSKLFVANLNLKYTSLEEGVRADGRAPKFLEYDAQLHTNKLRIILKHDAAIKHSLHCIFEIFKE